MGIAYNPRIVTDGLSLLYDVGNIKGDPGTGTSWIDTSGNGKTGSFVNTLSTSGGYFSFGETNRVETPSIDVSGAWTVCSWIYLLTNNQYTHILTSSANQRNFTCKLGTSSSTVSPYFYSSSGNTTVGDTTPLIINTWYYLTYQYTGTNIRIYNNGELDYDGSGFNLSLTSYTMRINGGNDEYNSFRNAMIQVYNRALSADEVKQNYLATKGRFGL